MSRQPSRQASRKTIFHMLLVLILGAYAINAMGCLLMVWEEDGRHQYDDEPQVHPDDVEPPQEPEEPQDPAVDCPQAIEVCGEDGVTYPSPCDASRAKVHVAYDGACGQLCAIDAECDEQSICGERGICEVASCPALAADDHSQEVCGADGFTYQSECEARLLRVEILHQGCCI